MAIFQQQVVQKYNILKSLTVYAWNRSQQTGNDNILYDDDQP